MKKKRPVLQDVADRVGVTKMTVSRFLRNPEQVSVALRGKIAAALDEIATLLSDGASVAEVTQDNSDEYGISQIFIAIEVDKLIDGPTRDAKLQRIMDYVTSAERADENQAIRLPGHEFTTLLAENRRNGITVDDSVWAKIQAL